MLNPTVTHRITHRISSSAADQATLHHEEDLAKGAAFALLKDVSVGFPPEVKVECAVSFATGGPTAEVIAAMCERYVSPL